MTWEGISFCFPGLVSSLYCFDLATRSSNTTFQDIALTGAIIEEESGVFNVFCRNITANSASLCRIDIRRPLTPQLSSLATFEAIVSDILNSETEQLPQVVLKRP